MELAELMPILIGFGAIITTIIIYIQKSNAELRAASDSKIAELQERVATLEGRQQERDNKSKDAIHRR